MIKVYQTNHIIKDGYGSCFNACIASIFELAINEIPAIYPNTKGNWWVQWDYWLAERGKKFVYYYLAEAAQHGYGIAITETNQTYPQGHPKAGKPITHAVVVLDGKIVHDPSPVPNENLTIKYYQMLEDLSDKEIKQHHLDGPGCIHGYRKYCEICID